jgi:hypothetical protein
MAAVFVVMASGGIGLYRFYYIKHVFKCQYNGTRILIFRFSAFPVIRRANFLEALRVKPIARHLQRRAVS